MTQLELDFTPDVFDHEDLIDSIESANLEETQDSTYGYHYNPDASVSVSYTHLTLPTKRIV